MEKAPTRRVMTFVRRPNFTSTYRGVNARLAFNQEKALVGAFSVIVETGCGTD